MKTILSLGLVALLGMSARANSRNPESPTAMMSIQVGTISKSPLLFVRVAKPLGQSAYLQIVDKYGHAVFLDRIGKKEGSWKKALRMSDLPPGTYRLVVTDHRYRIVHEQTFQVDLPVLPEPEPRVTIL